MSSDGVRTCCIFPVAECLCTNNTTGSLDNLIIYKLQLLCRVLVKYTGDNCRLFIPENQAGSFDISCGL